MTKRRSDRLRGRRPAGLLLLLVAPEENDFPPLNRTESPFFHDALCESLLVLRVVKGKQRAGVARAEDTGRDALLHTRREVQ